MEITPEGKADTKRIDTQMRICLFTVVAAVKENPCGGPQGQERAHHICGLQETKCCWRTKPVRMMWVNVCVTRTT